MATTIARSITCTITIHHILLQHLFFHNVPHHILHKSYILHIYGQVQQISFHGGHHNLLRIHHVHVLHTHYILHCNLLHNLHSHLLNTLALHLSSHEDVLGALHDAHGDAPCFSSASVAL